MKKLTRVAEYLNMCEEKHEYVMERKSLQKVICTGAAYETPGVVVGFESDGSGWITLISGKESVIAKASGEAELIVQNKVEDMIEWLIQLMEEVGYLQSTVSLYADSTCAMNMVKNGTGSFKRAKHI
jgi:hypothetical protein